MSKELQKEMFQQIEGNYTREPKGKNESQTEMMSKEIGRFDYFKLAMSEKW